MLVNFNELKRLSSIKNEIKQGNRSKKVIDLDTHHEIKKLYKPVIDPLQEIVKDQKAISRAIEVGPSIQPLSETDHVPLAIEDIKYKTLRLGILADRYLKIPSILYDHAYGIKPVEGSTNFRLGRMDVKIEGDDFIIDEEKYKGTEGVWRLLTLKNPGSPSADDLNTYRKMMTKTKAFLLEGQDRVKCNRGNKYKTIIKPIADEWKGSVNYSSPYTTSNVRSLSRNRADSPSGQSSLSGSPSTSTAWTKSTSWPEANPSGSGIVKPRVAQPGIVKGGVAKPRVATLRDSKDPKPRIVKPVIFLPSDPNELVDRHRVLFGAYQAGNTGVFNELHAINDKLLELGIFDLEIIEKFSIL